MADYNLSYSGLQVNTAIGKALNPDTTVTEGSNNLITSGGVKTYVDGHAVDYPNQPITLAAYNALTTLQKNADIVYQITDDTVGGLLATKAELTAGLATKANNSDVSTKANKASAFTVTLDDNSWNNQSLTINNINFEANGYSYIISPASTSFLDYLGSLIYADDVTTNGSMTFHCDATPVVDIIVNVFKAEVV